MVSDLWITAHISNPFWIKGEGFFRSMHRLTLSIYNGVIQGHVNRLDHVQSVFARRPPRPSLTLTHSLSPLLCLLLSLSHSPSPLHTRMLCFALFSLSLSLSIYPLHTEDGGGVRMLFSLIPSSLLLQSPFLSIPHVLLISSLSAFFNQSPLIPTLTISSLPIFLSHNVPLMFCDISDDDDVKQHGLCVFL